MRLCPNCGQDAGSENDRFCPHCGYLLPEGQAAAPTGTAASMPATPPPMYPPPVQPRQQPDPASYSAPPTYAQPTPNGYAPPSYLSGSSGANLPQPLPRQRPRRNASSSMAGLSTLARASGAMDNNSLIRLAVVVVLAIVAIIVLVKVVSWFLSFVLPLLIIAALVALAWRYMQRRGRRLP